MSSVIAMDRGQRSHLRRIIAANAVTRGVPVPERAAASIRRTALVCDPAPRAETRSRGCQWPLWPAGRVPRPAPFCGAARVEGRAYCAAHIAIAFTTTQEDTDG